MAARGGGRHCGRQPGIAAGVPAGGGFQGWGAGEPGGIVAAAGVAEPGEFCGYHSWGLGGGDGDFELRVQLFEYL